MPQPGKPADVLAELPTAWPSAGQHVWGRVKGHGWWPGVVIGGAAAEAALAAARSNYLSAAEQLSAQARAEAEAKAKAECQEAAAKGLELYKKDMETWNKKIEPRS